jgi:hypothetical protein
MTWWPCWKDTFHREVLSWQNQRRSKRTRQRRGSGQVVRRRRTGWTRGDWRGWAPRSVGAARAGAGGVVGGEVRPYSKIILQEDCQDTWRRQGDRGDCPEDRDPAVAPPDRRTLRRSDVRRGICPEDQENHSGQSDSDPGASRSDDSGRCEPPEGRQEQIRQERKMHAGSRTELVPTTDFIRKTRGTQGIPLDVHHRCFSAGRKRKSATRSRFLDCADAPLEMTAP